MHMARAPTHMTHMTQWRGLVPSGSSIGSRAAKRPPPPACKRTGVPVRTQTSQLKPPIDAIRLETAAPPPVLRSRIRAFQAAAEPEIGPDGQLLPPAPRAQPAWHTRLRRWWRRAWFRFHRRYLLSLRRKDLGPVRRVFWDVTYSVWFNNVMLGFIIGNTVRVWGARRGGWVGGWVRLRFVACGWAVLGPQGRVLRPRAERAGSAAGAAALDAIGRGTAPSRVGATHACTC